MKVDTHGSKEEEWIGFDLDGTLAKYDGWKGIEHIGEPVDTMVIIAKMLHRIGKKIKILTARVAPRDDGEGGDKAKKYVEAWCKKNLGFVPEITYEKDASMAALFDDRAVAVEQNTGKVLGGWPDFLPKASDKAKKAVLGKTEKKAEEDGIATLIGYRDGKSIYRLDYDFSKAKYLRDKIRKYMTRSTLRKLLQWPSGSGGGFADRVGNEGYAIHIDDSGKYHKTDAERKFVELHELGHIVNGHPDEKHDIGHGPNKERREEEANKYVLENAPQDMLDDIKRIIADRFGTNLTEKNAGARPSKEDLWRMYDIMQADAKLSGKVSGLGFGRNGDALRRAAIKLKVKELANVLRDGKRIRNRIAHTPGYIPSEQDAGRALRQYSDADRKISEIISK